ncbi:glucokinase [Yoonia sediminilitoris]|uniref:Glucokinase n=1 Tax=Yoonia sediminilitoris TaxID=1286148 RepID=A0A2T6KRQ7_9RHOB|nr:ROK family protein [Yoonia sediminilitoris]PUB19250.1 glucokinase [Yoonia sediminilitoris]RCW99418.1 glucokinase [Yoonia sediminilitoris]
MAHPKNAYAIVADIGGTNTRVALADGLTLVDGTIRRYRNREFPGLEAVIKRYIADENNVDPIGACVAVAGPVRDERATMTNLDWTIDKDTLTRATRAEHVAILNDLQAQGHALGHIDPANVRSIISGPEPQPNAAKLVIGVGTGFNAAPVFDLKSGRVVTPSESGHANLPIRNARELQLCEFVSTAHGFPAVEDVLSGRGLERVYAFLGQEAGDPRECAAQDIMTACASGDDERAVEAARLFTRILGTVCGNLSLIQLPFGGVYLVGGVARAFAPHLVNFGFVDAFKDKGRFAGFMNNFAVHVIEDDYAALTGSAAHLQGLHAQGG